MPGSTTPSLNSPDSDSPLLRVRHIFRPSSWWLLLLAIPAVWPLFHDGLPNRVDRGLYLIRIALLDHNIRQGNLFPRWMPEMMLGRGYPLLTFYGAGVYYLSEIPALLGMSIYDSSVVTLVFLTLVAGFGMYLFAADLFSGFSRWVPLVAAVAYLYAPYFLITNLYMRGAIAEVMAQALMPWALWSLRRIFNSDQPARYAVATSLLVASIVYSHTLSILIFPPLVAAYLALLWWLSGWQRVRLLWALFAVASAVAITAFFWLPLILRRSDISDVGYAVALGSWLPNGTWDWRSFLDDDWQYFYRRSGQPPRFGLVQFLLAMSGAALAFVRGRNREVWFFAIVGLLASFLVGRWALPLWSSTEILQAIQHPYRLLSILSISTAILTGALVVYFPVARLRAIVAIAVIGLFIFANYPRLGLPLPVFARQNMLVTLPAVAQTEAEQGVEQGGELSSMVQEFRPRWAGQNLVYTGSADVVAPAMDVAITDANSVTTRMTVSNSAPASLHFNDFYFPGWQIVRNGQERLPIYASTNLGLLTVDLPPGTHQLTVRYAGGLPERIAGLISLFGLAVLASVAVRYRYYWLSAVPILLFIWGGVAMFYQPAPQPVQTPVSSWEESGLRLAGVRHKQASPNTLTLYPYWYVLAAQQPDVRFRWQLLDADGGIVAETLAYPYFNASTADTWPPGTLVDDAVQLAIPAGVDAGSYELALGLDTGTDGDGNTVPQVVASITLPGTPPETLIEGMNSTDAIYDELVRLKGFTVTADGRDLHFGDDDPPVVRHGEPVRYTLYWRALDAITENYHSYVHLNDSAGRSVAKQDQLPGPFFRPPKMWDKVQLQPGYASAAHPG